MYNVVIFFVANYDESYLLSDEVFSACVCWQTFSIFTVENVLFQYKVKYVEFEIFSFVFMVEVV